MYNSSSVCAVSSQVGLIVCVFRALFTKFYCQARALCAQRSSIERHRFLVGTCSLHEANDLSVLQYSEDSNHFESVAIYNHPDQIWAMDSSAKDSSLVATSRQASDCSKSITVWRMPNQQKEDLESDVSSGYSSETMDLQEVATFNQSQKPAIVRSIRWHATEDQLLGVDNKLMTTWDVTSGKVSPLSWLCSIATQPSLAYSN